MLLFASFDIVFQEIPDEVTLVINISNCPNCCKGCHSPHLQKDIGEELTESVLSDLLHVYGNAVTCVCFMGGDGMPDEVLRMAQFVRQFYKKTAWYSGNSELYGHAPTCFDYIKLGKYVESLGGLTTPTTNQRLYQIENTTMMDITNKFINP